MGKAIKIIRSEHAGLVAIHRTLDALLKDIEAQRVKPDFILFQAMVEYLSSFMYRFHHPKETDHLFPAIVKRDKTAEGVVKRLEAQHKQGASLLKELEQALVHYEQEGDSAFPVFREAFDRYHDFEWRHMSMEEKEILPLAKRILSQQDWDEVDKVFTDHEDPLFGDNKRKEFQHLFEYIVRHAPAPYGLGDADH